MSSSHMVLWTLLSKVKMCNCKYLLHNIVNVWTSEIQIAKKKKNWLNCHTRFLYISIGHGCNVEVKNGNSSYLRSNRRHTFNLTTDLNILLCYPYRLQVYPWIPMWDLNAGLRTCASGIPVYNYTLKYEKKRGAMFLVIEI